MSTHQLLADWLTWDRAAIEHGQVWRLGTASLVHLTWHHAAANLIGLVIWWRLESLTAQPLSVRTRLAAIVSGSFGVGLLLLAFSDYSWYAGASGTVYGLFAFTALRSGARGLMMLGLLLGWLVLGPHLVSYSFPVAAVAHWAGVSLGLAGAAVCFSVRRHRSLMRPRSC